MKIIEWNQDDKIVTYYKRSGECSQCGACCRAYVKFKFHLGGIGDDGIWREIKHKGDRFICKMTEVAPEKESCSSLEGNTCCWHDSDEKPIICQAWPLEKLFDECTYEFRETASRTYEENDKALEEWNNDSS